MALEDDKGRPIPVPLTHEANQWPEQKIVNAVAILELVRILVGPNNPNTVVNQACKTFRHLCFRHVSFTPLLLL